MTATTLEATTLEDTTLEVTSAPINTPAAFFNALSNGSLTNLTPVPLVEEESFPILLSALPQVADAEILAQASKTNLNPDNLSPEEFKCLTSHNRYRYKST